jgi:hypothetical protein
MSTFAPEGPPDLSGLIGAPAPAEPDTSAGVTSARTGGPEDDLRHAALFVQSYMEAETDDEDLAAASKILHDIQKLLASQQKLTDRATGAGPGARILRKATARRGY